MAPVPPVQPLTSSAKVAFDAWSVKATPCKVRLAAIPASATVAQNLVERAAVDQCLRALLPPSPSLNLSEADRKAVDARIFGQIAEVDLANTAFLKSVMPASGWFRASRDGRGAAHAAWLIVQHSPDQELQRDALVRMEPLAKAGEINAGDYALLYDRTEVFAGRSQYYGSQFHCQNGHYVLLPTRDPDSVDARRKAIGLSTVAENAVRINAQGC